MRKVRGSFTVEAAFLLPIILTLIFSLFYIIFYEHDRVGAEVMLYEQLREKEQTLCFNRLSGALMKSTKMEHNFENQYENVFFLLQKQECKSEINRFFIKEKIFMKGKCSLFYLHEWIEPIGLSFQREIRLPVYNPMEILRIKDIPEERLENLVTGAE